MSMQCKYLNNNPEPFAGDKLEIGLDGSQYPHGWADTLVHVMVEAWVQRLPIITYTPTGLNISLTAMFSASCYY